MAQILHPADIEMSGAMVKSLAIVAWLIAYPDVPRSRQFATELNRIHGGCHRTLPALIRYGCVRQSPLHLALVDLGADLECNHQAR
jgi:hypothetical protein